MSGTEEASSEKPFPVYPVGLLFVIFTLNFLDRQILNILAEPIKQDLGLADWQIGALTGLAFALLYTTFGIPVARLADRHHRGKIIAVSLFIWSGFTALSGLATSFVQLLLFRIGVGMGEAGCSPATQSLIGDITSKAVRARALAIYALGVPVGSLLGMVVGGLAVDAWGWRNALLLAGLPGLLVAVLTFLTLRDPRSSALRETGRAAGTQEGDAIPTFREACRELAGKKSFWWLAGGAALTSFVGYGHLSFYASFFMRNHQGDVAVLADWLGLGTTGALGIALGLLLGVGGALGTYGGGAVADRHIGRGPGIYAFIPAIGTLLAIPFFVLAFTVESGLASLACLLLPTIFKNMWYGPVFACVQSIVHERSRATAMAVFLLILNACGIGAGPISIGLLSDALAATLGPAEGLRWAMIILTAVSALAGLCFFQARKSIANDQRIRS